jgi:hypothetical protein
VRKTAEEIRGEADDERQRARGQHFQHHRHVRAEEDQLAEERRDHQSSQRFGPRGPRPFHEYRRHRRTDERRKHPEQHLAVALDAGQSRNHH